LIDLFEDFGQLSTRFASLIIITWIRKREGEGREGGGTKGWGKVKRKAQVKTAVSNRTLLHLYDQRDRKENIN